MSDIKKDRYGFNSIPSLKKFQDTFLNNPKKAEKDYFMQPGCVTNTDEYIFHSQKSFRDGYEMAIMNGMDFIIRLENRNNELATKLRSIAYCECTGWKSNSGEINKKGESPHHKDCGMWREI